MGSNEIEREIVRMDFDGKGFQSGIKSTLDSLSRLKQSFNLKGVLGSLSALNNTAKADFNPMAAALANINNKLSLGGVAAAAFISRVTNAVMDGVKNLANVLVLEPIKAGLEEYETQLNAVQTILANTAKDGTSLQDVNNALDELNEYADLTIYNFTQMTDSIGKFTTAGVDLDTSVSAIKGIANVAAISGANAESASRAMYQLSQAISSGTVRLQDWMSVENAGLGGQVFKDAIIDTARAHGVAVDQIIDKAGSFRNSLQEQWLSADIMLETLSKFTGDLSDAELLAMGYTEQQIADIQNVAQMANDAATKIKTFTQLKDTMQEALQSGWGQTWRIIFGDFEEAKELWGGIGQVFGDLIANSSDARNAVLEGWKGFGGRVATINTFHNVLSALLSILGALGDGFRKVFAPIEAKDLATISLRLMQFTGRLAEAAKSGFGPISKVAQGFAAALDIVKMVVLALIHPFRRLVGPLKEGSGGFLQFLVRISEAIIKFRDFAVKMSFFILVVETIEHEIGNLIEKIREVVEQFSKLEIVQDIANWFKSLTKSDFVAVWTVIASVASAAVFPFVALFTAIKLIVTELKKFKVVQDIGKWFNDISWGGLKQGFKDATTESGNFFDKLKQSQVLTSFRNLISAVFSGDQITKFFSAGREHFAWFTNILTTIKDKLFGVGDGVKALGAKTSGLGQSLSDAISGALDYLTDKAQNIDYDKFFDRLIQVLNVGMLAAIAGAIRSLASGGWLENAMEKFGLGQPKEIGNAIVGMFGSVEGVMTSFQNNIKADTLRSIAISIGILAASMIVLTFIDSNKLMRATAAIGALIVMLFGATGAIGNIDTQSAAKASVALIAMSLSITLLAAALYKIAEIDESKITSSLLAMTAGLSSLVIAVTKLQGGSTAGMARTIATMVGIAISLQRLTEVIKTFGEMEPRVLAQGLAMVAVSLGMLSVSAKLLAKGAGKTKMASAGVMMLLLATSLMTLASSVKTFGNLDQKELAQGLASVLVILGGFGVFSRLIKPQGLIGAAVGIAVIAGALMLMVNVVRVFGSMNWDEILRGLVGLAGALLVVVLAANAMTGAIVGAAAMLVMSVAITALAAALGMLGQLSWDQLGVALAGLAGTFLILGLAGLLLAPVVPVLIALGVAMLLIGAGAGLLGLGLVAASVGLVAIASSASIIAAGISLVGAAIIKLLPAIGEAIAGAFVNFLTVIADNVPKVMDAMQRIGLGMIEGMGGMIPQVVALILDLMTQLLDAIMEKVPHLIDTGWKILQAFLDGIANNIREVVATGLEILTEFIRGLTDGIPNLVDSAFELILTFLEAIADAIEEYMPQIIAAGFKIGTNMIKGMVQGLWDGIEILLTAIKELVAEAIDRFKKSLGIESPSTVTWDMGKNLMFGLANGILDNAKSLSDAFKEFGKKVQNGIKPILDSINNGLEGSPEFSPVIRPVIDLDNIRTGLGNVDKAFGNTRLLADLAVATSTKNNGVSNSTPSADTKGDVTFIQNNYSPKALDRFSIWRETRSLVATLETA